MYAAKCYWPGVTASALEQAAARAAADVDIGVASSTGNAVDFLGSILFQDDEVVLCLFDAPSRTVVWRTTERAGIPCERVIDAHWLPRPAERGTGDRLFRPERHGAETEQTGP